MIAPIIRKANNNDLPKIINIINKHYQKYGDFVNLNKYDKDLKDIEKNYFQQKGCFWIAQLNNNIIGTIALQPLDSSIAEIKRVYVREAYHGTIISHKLMQKVLNFAIDNHYQKVILWSDSRYKRAHNFFLKYKFIPLKKQKFYDADKPYTSILFELKLKNY
jgi:N-acetylglutamate synthase-like GNAT family acetyltransferase